MDQKLITSSFSYILKDMHMPVIALDTDGNLIYINPQFLKLTGYSEHEVLGASWFKTFIPQNKLDTVSQKFKAVINDKYSMLSEDPVIKKDGGILTVEWHNFPLIKDQKVLGVISIGNDVTARNEVELLLRLNEKTMRERAEMYEKQNKTLEETKKGMLNLLDDANALENALQNEKHNVEKKVEERTGELNQEKARLLASINAFPSGFIVTDTNKKVLIANDTLSRLFNTNKIEWHLDQLHDYLQPALNFKEHFEQVMLEKKPLLLKNIDTGRKIYEIYIAPIFLSTLNDETIGNIVLITDVTEEIIIERSKDEFFSIASHELRTPLTAIRGNIEMVKKHFSSMISDNNFIEMIDDIHSSSERLISLVNEFLNMSRLEQGRLKLEHETFDVCQLIDDIVGELQQNAFSKNIYLRFTKPNFNCPTVTADKNRVREVIVNLLGNAITYTDMGGINISVLVHDSNLKVSVTDTGRGISVQNQNLLFRKFQQANSNIYTRDASRGTGLGLYISKLMIEAMNGTIYLEQSEVGVGSTFVFTLPLA